MIVYCHNVSAIDVDYHFVREMLAKGGLIVRHVPTQSQVADIFTEGLQLTCLLNIVPIYPLFHPVQIEGVYWIISYVKGIILYVKGRMVVCYDHDGLD